MKKNNVSAIYRRCSVASTLREGCYRHRVIENKRRKAMLSPKYKKGED